MKCKKIRDNPNWTIPLLFSMGFMHMPWEGKNKMQSLPDARFQGHLKATSRALGPMRHHGFLVFQTNPQKCTFTKL